MLSFVDVETTGISTNDKICSIACLIEDGISKNMYYDLVNEGKKIPPKASSINNITNEMIASKPPLQKSQTYNVFIESIANNATVVAHNLPFELQMFTATDMFLNVKGIDTLRVSRHLIPDLESYALNFLRYEMKLYKREKALAQELGVESECLQPHDARSDVIMTKLLFDELLELASVEKMLDLSYKPVLLQKFEFGKYAGRYIEEIAMIDRKYLEWMLCTLDDLSEDMRYTLEYYL